MSYEKRILWAFVRFDVFVPISVKSIPTSIFYLSPVEGGTFSLAYVILVSLIRQPIYQVNLPTFWIVADILKCRWRFWFFPFNSAVEMKNQFSCLRSLKMHLNRSVKLKFIGKYSLKEAFPIFIGIGMVAAYCVRKVS